MQSLACTVTADHLRFDFVATNAGDVLFVVFLHMCILQSSARFYCRHVAWGHPENIAQPSRWQKLVDRLWFWACLLTAAPGVVYSAVKAVILKEAHEHVKASGN
eukprot:5230243-Amphidinium_carterae.1